MHVFITRWERNFKHKKPVTHLTCWELTYPRIQPTRFFRWCSWNLPCGLPETPRFLVRVGYIPPIGPRRSRPPRFHPFQDDNFGSQRIASIDRLSFGCYVRSVVCLLHLIRDSWNRAKPTVVVVPYIPGPGTLKWFRKMGAPKKSIL